MSIQNISMIFSHLCIVRICKLQNNMWEYFFCVKSAFSKIMMWKINPKIWNTFLNWTVNSSKFNETLQQQLCKFIIVSNGYSLGFLCTIITYIINSNHNFFLFNRKICHINCYRMIKKNDLVVQGNKGFIIYCRQYTFYICDDSNFQGFFFLIFGDKMWWLWHKFEPIKVRIKMLISYSKI